MRKEQVHISTIASDAAEVAFKYGVGLEIAEYCTAFNMDEYFEETDKSVRQKISDSKTESFVFHAPFNELSPAAVDPKVLAVTKDRYIQSIRLAESYGIHRLVIHSGFSSDMYFKEWFEERSVEFWKAFFEEVPGDYTVLYENVFEKDPEQLLKIVQRVGNERFKLCFDIGHANVVSRSKDVFGWLETYAPFIGHFHIHNNYGERDEHNELFDGNIDMKAFLERASDLCPNATYTLEVSKSEPSIKYMSEIGLFDI